jgi:DNA polymerase bacteriophage-type
MIELGLDIETFSNVSLKSGGLHKYIEDEGFEILLIAYSFEGAEPICIDLKTNPDYDQLEFVLNCLENPNYLKTAWNAQFEINCLKKFFGLNLDPSQWECTMVKAAMLGYPLGLDECGKAMNLEIKKSAAGKALVKYFSEPYTGKRLNQRPRNLPKHDPYKWQQYIEYNIFDVKAEQAIRNRIKFFKISDKEKLIWLLDQKINERGIMLDEVLIKQAILLDARTKDRLLKEATEITGLANPNSLPQLKKWIEDATDTTVSSLTKENVKEMIKEHDDEIILRLLGIRQELAKTSIRKYVSMTKCICKDHKVRGLLQYYGANKTGRWSARLVQLHNLPKNKMKEIHLIRKLVREGRFEDLEFLFDNLSNPMSEMIRTAFIASENNTLLVSDFSAIEARVTAWYADEDWRLNVFYGDGLIYEESGARMFKTTPQAVAADEDGLRFKAKTAELALGFQGGVGAIQRMEKMGLKTGLTHDEMEALVKLWRQTNPNIVRLWYKLEECAIEAVDNPGSIINFKNRLRFQCKNGYLFIQLPSGRLLSYVAPFLRESDFREGAKQVGYWAIDQDNHQWSRQYTYGGKITENVVQGTARDLLADTMLRLDVAEFDIALHVHDEVVMEVGQEESEKRLIEAGEIMEQDISWAKGLPIRAKGYLTPYYLKK